MTRNYGTNRVMEPQHVLPTSAWRLDNSRNIAPEEIRVDIKRIHIEQTSFKQICLEAADNDQRIKQKIMDIVIRRGKLHNPVTDTGGCSTVPSLRWERSMTTKKRLQTGRRSGLQCVPGLGAYIHRQNHFHR